MSLRSDFFFSWDPSATPKTRRPLSDKLRWQILKRDRFRCAFCGAHAGDVELQIDHLWPVSRGGTNHKWNLAACCTRCNSGKRAEYIEVLFTRYHRLGISQHIADRHGDKLSIALLELSLELYGDVQCWLNGWAESYEGMRTFDVRSAHLEKLFGSETIQ